MLLYASKYHDVKTVANLSGRYDLKTGLENLLGKNFLERIRKEGFIELKTKSGIRPFNQPRVWFKYINWCRRMYFRAAFKKFRNHITCLFLYFELVINCFCMNLQNWASSESFIDLFYSTLLFQGYWTILLKNCTSFFFKWNNTHTNCNFLLFSVLEDITSIFFCRKCWLSYNWGKFEGSVKHKHARNMPAYWQRMQVSKKLSWQFTFPF